MNRLAISPRLRASLAFGFLVFSAAAPGEEPAAEKPKSLELQVTEALDAVDLTPPPPFEVPDPPPHEGAMIDVPPYVIEPPDLVLVEVLDALEGRPISGERLVRPDGTIGLGFYGEVHVRGLTIEQARIKIVKVLRNYLTDELLGLVTCPAPPIEGTPEAKDYKPPTPSPPADSAPKEKGPRADARAQRTPSASNWTARIVSDGFPIDRLTRHWRTRTTSPGSLFAVIPTGGLEPVATAAATDEPVAPAATPGEPTTIKTGDVTITIKVESNGGAAKTEPAAEGELTPCEHGEPFVVDPTLGRTKVFVDVTAYNSKNYSVLGATVRIGKLPFTGKETVLDAIHYSGGLLAAADADHIALIRPGVAGKPPRIYKVDLRAIELKGETQTNYQLFPGDRLYVPYKRAPREDRDPEEE